MQLSGGGSGALQSEINITPLVDVVLVLLIIFMVVVPLLMQGYDVNIPKSSADAVQTPPAEETQLILTIDLTVCDILAPPVGEGLPADCRVRLDGQEIPAADLPARVSEILGGRPADQHVLFLAVDDRLNYEGVLRVVDLAKTGVDDLRIEFITAD
jgi:biopolymer transport protein TolR